MAAETQEYELLYDEAGIREDLRACRTRDRDAFDVIVALLGELRGKPALSENFVLPGWNDLTIEDVDWIESLLSEGIDATRVKIWAAREWRLIFFADHSKRRSAFAAEMHSSQNYEKDKYLWQRLRDAYDRLGFERR